jgi:endoglucanase
VFNSSLTYYLTEVATEVAKKDKSFLFQRCLMPGGTCEATVYDAFGYHTSSICIPLGNYHNMDKKRQKLAAEYVNKQDWENMVRLFVAVVRSGHTYQTGHLPLHKKLNDLWQEKKALLA